MEPSMEAPGHAASRRKHEAASRTHTVGIAPVQDDSTERDRLRAAAYAAERRARSWIEANPGAWGYMLKLAAREVGTERFFGVKWLIEQARKKDFADVRGQRTEINNSLSSALARILVEQMPEAAPFVELRRSVFEEAR